MKATPAQLKILRKAAVHKSGRVMGGDPRTIIKLVDFKLIEPDGYYFGPLFKISDAGRQLVKNLAPAWSQACAALVAYHVNCHGWQLDLKSWHYNPCNGKDQEFTFRYEVDVRPSGSGVMFVSCPMDFDAGAPLREELYRLATEAHEFRTRTDRMYAPLGNAQEK